MKPFGKRRDHMAQLPPSGLTGRQLTAIAVAFALAIVLAPVGARAAQFVSSIITDPGGVNQATVDRGGNLHVAGTMSVDSSTPVSVSVDDTTPVSVTSLDDPGRHPFEATAGDTFESVGEFAIADFPLVPAGKRLVLEYVSVLARIPSGQRLLQVELTPLASNAIHLLPAPTFTGTGAITPLLDHYVTSQDLRLYVAGNSQLRVVAERDSTLGHGTLLVSISGYLIDCSASPCS
jgi:hypothetical protein